MNCAILWAATEKLKNWKLTTIIISPVGCQKVTWAFFFLILSHVNINVVVIIIIINIIIIVFIVNTVFIQL